MASFLTRRCWTSSAKKIIGHVQQRERSASALLASWSPAPSPKWTCSLMSWLRSRSRSSELACCTRNPMPPRSLLYSEKSTRPLTPEQFGLDYGSHQQGRSPGPQSLISPTKWLVFLNLSRLTITFVVISLIKRRHF